MGTPAQDLKPCPFCGSDEPVPETDDTSFFVVCWNCRATGPIRANYPEAIAKWNQRAEEPAKAQPTVALPAKTRRTFVNPCPCGATKLFCYSHHRKTRIYCKACGRMGPQVPEGNNTEAIAEWNQRVIPR